MQSNSLQFAFIFKFGFVDHETYFANNTGHSLTVMINNVFRDALRNKKNLRDTRVKVVFPFPKSGLLCKEIITLRLLPHVIKGHTFSYRPSSHLKDLIQQT